MAWLAVGGAALSTAWLVWRSLTWPLVHDAPLMHYVAWRISQGAVPYRDLFDMNFPGVYLLHLLVVGALGTGDLAWRLFDLAWLTVLTAGAAAFVAPWGRLAAAGVAVLIPLYHLSGGAWQAGQRDFLLSPFLILGALGVARWIESGERRALTWGGLALGASLTIKPHGVALVATLGLVVAVTAWRAGGTLAPPLLFLTGALVAPVAVVAWLALVGGLAAWQAIVFEYLVPLYARLGTGEWSVYRPGVWIPIGAGALLSGVGALAARRFGARHAIAAIGVLYGAFHVVAQGKGWEYHLHPLAVFMLVLLVAEAPAAPSRWRPITLPLVLGLVVTLTLLADKARAVSPAGWERDRAERARRLAVELAPRLAPGETVQVLDTTDGGIHALLRLGARQPTRFLYDFHFFHDPDHPTIRALRAELLRDLDARPPALIVLFEHGWPTGGYERVESFPGLAERLLRYDLVQAGPGYHIHAQRHR